LSRVAVAIMPTNGEEGQVGVGAEEAAADEPDDVDVLLVYYATYEPAFAVEEKVQRVIRRFRKAAKKQGGGNELMREMMYAEFKSQRGVDPRQFYWAQLRTSSPERHLSDWSSPARLEASIAEEASRRTADNERMTWAKEQEEKRSRELALRQDEARERQDLYRAQRIVRNGGELPPPGQMQSPVPPLPEAAMRRRAVKELAEAEIMGAAERLHSDAGEKLAKRERRLQDEAARAVRESQRGAVQARQVNHARIGQLSAPKAASGGGGGGGGGQ
jgi:hypothetical protein